MSISFTGDFSKLDQLIAGVDQLASKSFTRQCNAAIAEEAISQVQYGFDTGTDPYGRPWKPPARRKGQPLRDTGRLMNSFRASSNTAGFEVRSKVSYAGYHQNGTRWLVVRAMLPRGGRLGTRWRNAFKGALRRVRKQKVGW